ncbi:MAG: Do family serine endopeptidase [Candidatus Marinarcus sp.]|uniref:Do family serine endopeptidase n=1 Tax=Candidatus Marinarcus sp. TaxID=3100987 RepID=UPI003B0049F2
MFLTTKKVLIISSLLTVNIFASNITFQTVAKNPQRVVPNTQQQIFSFHDLIKDSVKSVVNVSAKRRVKSVATIPSQMLNDPFLKKFFGDQLGEQFKESRLLRSLGSGVVISSNGYIITNNHVVDNADEVMVTITGDDKEYPAKIIGKDADSDLAVIQIEAKGLVPIKFAHAEDLRIGDVIFAIGNPFGLGESISQGIISALNKNKVGINRYENFIQTDASINPGNSGGALVDSRGALIGINSVIISRSGGNDGIGFAIPINMVKNVAKKLIQDGKVTRGYLGVVIDDLSTELKNVYVRKEGALVLDVEEDTPAAKYGLKRGDLIYKINDNAIKDRVDLQNTVAEFKPNQKIVLEIERNKKDMTLVIVLADRSSLTATSNETVLGGLKLTQINDKIIDQFRLPRNFTGVMIKDVEPKSNAEQVGFQAGDVIIQIEDIEIKKLSDVQNAIKKYKKSTKRVYVNRFGQTILFVVK